MKFRDYLPFLLWLVTTCTASYPDPPLDIHPEVLMKREGQFMCLENDPMNMDVLRRHENTLRIYPEVTVGCETISRKPLKKHFEAPSHGTTFDEEIRKYFIIDVSGVERRVNKSESVIIIETYSSGVTSEMVPDSARATTEREFQFDQICFPIACYDSEETFDQVCEKDFSAAFKASLVNMDCLPVPGKENACGIPQVTEWRQFLKGHTGPAENLRPETSVYCIGSGPTLGPLRTPKYPAGQIFMSGRKGKHIQNFYKYVHRYDPRTKEPNQKIIKPGSYIAYTSGGYVDIEGNKFLLGCGISAPIEAPYNDTFGIHYLIMRGAENMEIQPVTIRKGDRIDLKSLYTPNEPESRGPSQIIDFDDLCFPADCKGKAVEDYKCKGKYKKTKSEVAEFYPNLAYAAHDLIYKKFLYPFDYERLARDQGSVRYDAL